ncbi:MAG: MFS transporter [Paludibacteraceae bacterium]|nr:MFS transporter [Paludibacteraceae bacterium]
MDKLWNKNYTKVWVANFMLFLSFMLLMPLLPLYLSDTFGANKQTIGIVLSGYIITTLLVRPFSGYIVDSFPRKAVLLICYSVFALFFAGYLVAGSLVLFAIVRTLHGVPFGATTVASSTTAIDVLPSSRRAEGIGYYGLSNNIATAIGPTIAIYVLQFTDSYKLLFALSLVIALIGLIINCTVDLPSKPLVRYHPKLSMDHFFLLPAWSEAIVMFCFGFSYSVVSTYLAIYGKEELDITSGAALYFALLSAGLILSRLTGARSLRNGKVVRNAIMGMVVSLMGYALFAGVHNEYAYYASAVIIGLGNGHMFPAIQNMFINLAHKNKRGTANSTFLISWDSGVGMGILLGGVVAEAIGYHAAFRMSCLVNAAGVAWFILYARNSYDKHKI